jgi:hypothetical protein
MDQSIITHHLVYFFLQTPKHGFHNIIKYYGVINGNQFQTQKLSGKNNIP